MDAGSGPGLMARLAHDRGYRALGIDRDASMIRLAQRRHAGMAGLRFVRAHVENMVERHGRFDVVSAASLLHVVSDRRAALLQLLDAVVDGGVLLVVETSSAMKEPRPQFRASNHGAGHSTWILKLWVRARRFAAPVDVRALCPSGYVVECHPLLDGLVNAWLVRRAT